MEFPAVKNVKLYGVIIMLLATVDVIGHEVKALGDDVGHCNRLIQKAVNKLINPENDRAKDYETDKVFIDHLDFIKYTYLSLDSVFIDYREVR